MKVFLKSGAEKWLLIHVEVQGAPERTFPERMFVYYYRIFDRYHKDVVSVAVFTDNNPAFHPGEYSRANWGTEVTFRYSMIKLMDYRARGAELEADPNPFAMVVRAFLRALETEGDFQARYSWKKKFLLELHQAGMPQETIRALYKFIDWIMRLPGDLETQLLGEIKKVKESNQMAYITTAERIGMTQGMTQGMAKGIAQSISVVLQIKFGEAAENLAQRAQQAQNADVLQKFLEGLRHAQSLTEAETMLAELERQHPVPSN